MVAARSYCPLAQRLNKNGENESISRPTIPMETRDGSDQVLVSHSQARQNEIQRI